MSEDQLATIFGDVTVVQFVLWLLAAVALLVLIVKAWPFVSRFVATMNALTKLPEKLDLIDDIYHELHPNSGLSMRDSTNRTEKQVAELKESVTSVSAVLAKHFEISDDNHARLAKAEQDIVEIRKSLNTKEK